MKSGEGQVKQKGEQEWEQKLVQILSDDHRPLFGVSV